MKEIRSSQNCETTKVMDNEEGPGLNITSKRFGLFEGLLAIRIKSETLGPFH